MEAQASNCGHVHLLRLNGGETWRELLTEAGTFAVAQGLGKAGLVDALLERETSYPTGVSAAVGIAIPHADEKYTQHTGVVVATLDKPSSFRPMGGGEGDIPTEVVFLLLMKDTGKHLGMLGTITDLIQDSAKMEALKGESAMEMLSAAFAPIFQ